MRVILFQNRFEQPILDGVKDCTIRAHRKDGRPLVRAGETISLRVWTGLPYRSKQREFAQRTVKFKFPVRVHIHGIVRLDTGDKLTHIRLSKCLGFSGWREAKKWYKDTHGLPFDGVLIHFPTP